MGPDHVTPSERRMRSDARDNRDKVLRAARAVFAEEGAHASLNRIAQRAGVGPGTLYRHFPSLQALLVAIIRDDVDRLCAAGHELLGHPDPGDALRIWLHKVAVHATAMRGLVAAQMLAVSGSDADAALAACHDEIRAAGSALLDRTRPHGAVTTDIDIGDLLTLVNAVAWASEQAHDDPRLLDRLMTFVGRGLG
ncbi:TetR/AcrR family transcriptional regulator [Protofrankia symbiont of Coriaria ruscifolia]|uniref:TetR/AcrR family transcriptional regulator n=1 Tax=Protofrankia symbiont of Coriaria ruscifolia TaxID=1306542 RepID=UPI001A944B67|nr:TetR/AcrR family transcriptional regulator [Protofrankia symbiont of Coriaria ruscifolia]